MSEPQVVVKQEKSIAPIILGIIAFILSIPAGLCNFINSVICGLFFGAATESASSGIGTFFFGFLPTVFLITCFVLCFFCKSPKAKIYGIVQIILACLILILFLKDFSLFCFAFGVIPSILYVVAGVISFVNGSRE